MARKLNPGDIAAAEADLVALEARVRAAANANAARYGGMSARDRAVIDNAVVRLQALRRFGVNATAHEARNYLKHGTPHAPRAVPAAPPAAPAPAVMAPPTVAVVSPMVGHRAPHRVSLWWLVVRVLRGPPKRF